MSESIKIPFFVYLVMFLVGGVSVYNAFSIHQLNKRLSAQSNLAAAATTENTNGAVPVPMASVNVIEPELEGASLAVEITNSSTDSIALEPQAEDLIQSQQREQERIELEKKLKMELAEQASHTESYESDAAKVASLLSKIEVLTSAVEK